MKELMSIMPYVVLAMSMAAALMVVFVAALRTLVRSFHRPTAVILALGVTILAVVGTTQIIFVRPHGQGSAVLAVPNGNALMLLPFVTLAVASLLAQVLAMEGGTAPQAKPQQVPGEIADVEPQVPPDAEPAKNTPAKAKPRGRPRKHPPEEPPQQLLLEDAAKKTSSSKQPRPAGTDAPAEQKPDAAAGSTEQS